MPRKPTPPAAPSLPPIHVIRRQRVMLDSDLAALYGVPTKRLNEAVRRNVDRFPEDFCFQLTPEELEVLRSQVATSKSQSPELQRHAPIWSRPTTGRDERRGGRRYRPWVFTEHGALMAGNVLNSPQAIQMSLYVVRAFVRMREALLTNATILKRFATIDKKLLEHDIVLQDVVEKLLPLLNPPPDEGKPRRRIGFR